jgi:hypothetical protein
LESQLETIRRITAVISNFSVPVDTVLNVMKLSIFSLSPAGDDDCNVITEVSGIIASFVRRASIEPLLSCELDYIGVSRQFVISSFCGLIVQSVARRITCRLVINLVSHTTIIVGHFANILKDSSNIRVKLGIVGIYLFMANDLMSCLRDIFNAMETAEPILNDTFTALSSEILRVHHLIEANLAAPTLEPWDDKVLGIPNWARFNICQSISSAQVLFMLLPFVVADNRLCRLRFGPILPPTF